MACFHIGDENTLEQLLLPEGGSGKFDACQRYHPDKQSILDSIGVW